MEGSSAQINRRACGNRTRSYQASIEHTLERAIKSARHITFRNLTSSALSELVDANVPVWKPGYDLELTTHRLDITTLRADVHVRSALELGSRRLLTGRLDVLLPRSTFSCGE